MKILVFGHIPSWAGGRQSGGDANVIYNLSYHLSTIPNTDVVLVATDVFNKVWKKDKLTIVGWSKRTLLKYIITHPLFTSSYFIKLIFQSIECKGAYSIFGMLFKGVFLRKSIQEYNPHVVHLHGLDAATYEKVIPSNVKVAVTHHALVCGDKNIEHEESLAKLERMTCYSKKIDKLYFVSNRLFEDFRREFSRFIPQTEVILNAYDSKCFYYIEPRKDEKLTFCTIASMSDRKGQERVVDALIVKGLKCRYICIGSIDETLVNRLKHKVVNSNLELIILGTMNPNKIRENLSCVDYMILPSSSEGFGLVFLEAIACGVPVILPQNLPIMSEKNLIKPGENAILLDDCSSRSIANIIDVIENSHFDHQSVSQTVINYTWTSIAQEYADSFRKLCI